MHGDAHPLFREGIEHFDAQRYYEAHESWEDLWRTLDGSDRLFLQALIQASVALHHLGKGNLAGARQLARATLSKLAVLPASVWGLDCEALAADFATRFDPILRGESAPPTGGGRFTAHPASSRFRAPVNRLLEFHPPSSCSASPGAGTPRTTSPTCRRSTTATRGACGPRSTTGPAPARGVRRNRGPEGAHALADGARRRPLGLDRRDGPRRRSSRCSRRRPSRCSRASPCAIRSRR